MGQMSGKVVLVTGASRGIGRRIALAMASERASVILAARNLEGLQRAATEIQNSGGTACAIATDVTNESDVGNLFDQVVSRHGKLDVLVNNAGLVEGGPIDQISCEVWDRVIATNVRGPFLCTREAMRIMKRQRGGRIINIGSISAQRPRINSSAYSVSKFAIDGLTRCTALEGREYGISASCLHPGNVRVEVPASAELSPPTEPTMDIEAVARTVVLIASLPPGMNMLETILLPVGQPYLGRG